jgi:hypothetical protein
MAGTRRQADGPPEDDEEEDLNAEPDNPDDWREYSEHPDDTMNERFDAEGWPRF